MKQLYLPSILSFLAFGLVMGGIATLQTGSAGVGLVVGLLTGAGFTGTLLIFLFAVRRFRMFGMKEVAGWAPGEVVVHSGDANMMRHNLAEGGRLFLTGMRLRFYGHRAGLEVGDLSFPLASLVSVERCRTLGIVPNGLRVALSDGREAKFVVHSPRRWIEAITQQRAQSVRSGGKWQT